MYLYPQGAGTVLPAQGLAERSPKWQALACEGAEGLVWGSSI